MLRVRVDLDVGRDLRFLSRAVAENVLAWIGLRVVAVRDDVDAGRTDREDRNLEAFRQRMDGDRRVGERGSEEGQQLSLLDEGLRHLGGLSLVRRVVLDLERDLGAVYPARIVDLVDRQEHTVPRARAVDATCPGNGKNRAELDRLTLV